MHALRRLHEALVPGGIVVDTQPVSPEPPVEIDDRQLGTLDMREWRRTIDAVDERVAQAVESGMFVVAGERACVVTDEFNSGDELLEVVSDWLGTTVRHELARAVTSAPGPVRLHQDVRVRLLRAA